MPPKTRSMNPPKMTTTTKKVTHSTNPHPHQEETPPRAVDDNPGSAHEADPGRAIYDHHSIPASQVIHEESRETPQDAMVKIAALEQRNHKLALKLADMEKGRCKDHSDDVLQQPTIREIPCPPGAPGRTSKVRKNGKKLNGFNVEDAMEYPVPPPDHSDHDKLKDFYHRQYLDTRKAARDALIAAKISNMLEFKNKKDSWVVQKCIISNEAVKRNIPWLTRKRFPNLWPLDAMAITYLSESNKYVRRVRNGKVNERRDDDEPGSEEQGSGLSNQASTPGTLIQDKQNRHEDEEDEEDEEALDQREVIAIVSPNSKGKHRAHPVLPLPRLVTGKRGREEAEVEEGPTGPAKLSGRHCSFCLDPAIEEEDRVLMYPDPRMAPKAGTSSHTSRRSASWQAESDDFTEALTRFDESGTDLSSLDQGGAPATGNTMPTTRSARPVTRGARPATRGAAPTTTAVSAITTATAPPQIRTLSQQRKATLAMKKAKQIPHNEAQTA